MAAKPVRIQLKRTKGWRKPANTVVVTRPGKWGNPFKPGVAAADPRHENKLVIPMNLDECIALYRSYVIQRLPGHVHELRGKNLACWCPLSRTCHADVLLELANK